MASAVVDSIGGGVEVGAACLPGQPDPLEALYANYAEPLRRFCRSRLDCGRQDEAEDACHETLLRASKALPRFRKGAPLWPWLATIAANVCKDMTRNDRRFSVIDDETADPAAAPDEELDRRDRAAIVVAAMGAVPLHYRKALYLREFEEWSWEDIARAEGKSVASVRSTLMRARRSLRSSIQHEAERVHQWPLPGGTPPRGWFRPWARFRERMAEWYPASPERALALLPMPALERLAEMLAGGGAAVAEGAAALVLTVGVLHGAAAVTPPSVSAPPRANAPSVSARAEASVDLGGGGLDGGSLQASVNTGPEDWWYRNRPMATVPVGDGGVTVVQNPGYWGEDKDGDGTVDYFGPGTAVVVEPPSETGVSGTFVNSGNMGAHCDAPERRTTLMVVPCGALERT